MNGLLLSVEMVESFVEPTNFETRTRFLAEAIEADLLAS